MGNFRKYACEISGVLFKDVNRKGIRREKLAGELDISVNQLKNYAYDSGKSATLENFLHALIKYKCTDVLDVIASEMGCIVSRLPESNGSEGNGTAAKALSETARAVSMYMEKENFEKEEMRSAIRSAIEKLVTIERSL